MITITFNKARTPMYFHADGSVTAPASAVFDTLITVISIGKIIGKLNIAIKPKLLFDRDDIAETIVSNEAKPREPNTREAMYKG